MMQFNDLGILSGWCRPFPRETVRRVLGADKKEPQDCRLAPEEDDPLVTPAASTTPVPAGAQVLTGA